jgi:tetratricopeptide (TPR) repeat protein
VSIQAEGESFIHFDRDYFNSHLQKAVDGLLPPFRRVIKGYVWFNLLFVIMATIEIVFFIFGMTWLTQSSTLAISLAIIFLTVFSFFILRAYLQAKKPLQCLMLRDRFIAACKSLISYSAGVPEHHLALANACSRGASSLQGTEYSYYVPVRGFAFLTPVLERFSFWWHWEDVHQMRELLLLYAVDEHLQLVKCEPTNLEVHTALANAYVMLSSLYVDHKKLDADDELWIPNPALAQELEKKFRGAAERAIEEFQILNDYAPDDPWIHAQLAYSYRDLQMPQEEIREYETILRLRPDDKETLYRLGTLYFQQGFNAKGLRVYEELKRSNFKRAESLIKHYGAYGQPEMSTIADITV